MDKEATDAAVAEFLKDPEGSIVGLVGLLGTKDDTRVRHALHAVVMRAGGEKEARPAVARALARTLEGERPTEVRGFILRQLQLVGTAKEAGAIGTFLLDDDLADDAGQALLTIRTGAADAFRAALPKAEGKQRVLIVHGLGTLKDKGAAEALRPLLEDKDRTHG